MIVGDIVASANGGFIDVSSQINNTVNPPIHVKGSLVGSNATIPLIYGHGALCGVIAVDGGIADASSVAEIRVGSYQSVANSAIAINYDGVGYENDTWSEGASVQIGNTPYTGPDNTQHIWLISECKGDMDNSGIADVDDEDPFSDALNDLDQYKSDFVGLEGSVNWHGDCNIDGNFNSTDQAVFDNLIESECCIVDWSFCPTDFDHDWDTDLSDLATLLSDYGCVSDCTYDLDGDGDVDLSDLATLLANYGQDCECSSGLLRTAAATRVTVSVAAVDTGGYTGGGFVGEVDHFVFDLKITVVSPTTDDWLVGGAAVATSNDATFLLSSSANTPNQYATFVAAPWTSVPAGATANVVGGYDPADSQAFTTTSVNLGWYDTNTASNDGPATILRLVIDVSDVDGADVSSGFGSVYFSTTGPTDEDDILVAELDSGVGTKLTGSSLQTRAGSFYVTGE